jgi:protein O-GlcNAc transferase
MTKRFHGQPIPRHAPSRAPAASQVQAYLTKAITLHQRGKLVEAERIYRAVLKTAPDHFDTNRLLAVLLLHLGHLVEGERLLERALKIKPSDPDVLNDRGNALFLLKRFEDALTSYNKAIAVNPDHTNAFYNRGVVLQEFKRLHEALASYDKAIALKPDHAGALNNRGNVLQELKRLHEALASYDKAIALMPNYVSALNNRGVVLQELKRLHEALASYDKAIALKSDHAGALCNRGNVLQELELIDEALASYERALTIEPDHKYAFSGLADSALKICDWARTAMLASKIKAHVTEKSLIFHPFTLLGYISDPTMQLKCAENYMNDKISRLSEPLWDGTVRRHHKIRIAYLSADFYRHATAFLTAELFELHDRSRFEVLGVSFGRDDESDMRSRLIESFDQFHDVRFKSDRDVAKLLNDLGVDIAVDLKGHTRDARPAIFAHRPAPLQVNYLGYPGTMGADFIDYVIGDEIVLPFDQQPYYTEKIVHLPECYQVNVSQKTIADHKTTRREAGLPENGFVFCCFNRSYKITEPIFDVWVRLLQAIDGSSLWLLRDNKGAEKNLREAAATRGVDPARLVFADQMALENHLARHRLADLFLDTLPINAHTTASDALWSGLPLLTCCGASFAGRVAASIVNAVGLPELATSNLEEYEGLALQLARNAHLLASIKAKLARNRDTYPLFKSNRFTRHLEAAYTTMWEIYQCGKSPRSFRVALMPDTE